MSITNNVMISAGEIVYTFGVAGALYLAGLPVIENVKDENQNIKKEFSNKKIFKSALAGSLSERVSNFAVKWISGYTSGIWLKPFEALAFYFQRGHSTAQEMVKEAGPSFAEKYCAKQISAQTGSFFLELFLAGTFYGAKSLTSGIYPGLAAYFLTKASLTALSALKTYLTKPMS